MVRHLLAGCETCLAAAQSLFLPGKEADYSGVLRRVELAAVLARNDVEVERRLGAEVWEQVLRALDAGGRLLAVRNEPGFCCWGLYERVLQEAAQVIRRKPVEAADLAHLAIEIADSLDVGSYGEERVQDYRAAAWSALGNAKRLAGDFSGAQEALEAAGEALARGTGDPLEKDIYGLPPEEAAKVPSVPPTLMDTLTALDRHNDFLRKGDVFSEDLIKNWVQYKYDKEIIPSQQRPTPYEFYLYFDQ